MSVVEGRERILVVDDEPLMRDFLQEFLARKRYRVEVAASGEDALRMLANGDYALTLTDWRMRGMDGVSLLRAARGVSPGTRFVIMTAYATVENAVEAMKLGASDYLTKPFAGKDVERVIERLLQNDRRAAGETLEAEDDGATGRVLVGESPQMREIRSLIRLAASTEATVLVTGETGTGKELVARAIHGQSRRREGRLIRLNCAALPETLLESELFGHERGAFTGAVRQRKGRFELAHAGTLLMDEVSEMGWGAQAKLLRVLQEKEFERVGGSTTIRVDTRVIATTNKDLAKEIREERFRADLYYRLSVFPISVPPLRERPADLGPLVEHFLRTHCKRNRLGEKTVSPEAMDLMRRHSWPGNVRELENCVERAVILAQGQTIRPEHLIELGEVAEEQGDPAPVHPVAAAVSLRDMETELLMRTLEEAGGNRTLAAHRLGISTRTLRNKLHRLGQMGFLKTGSEQGLPPHERGGKNVPLGPERVSSSGVRSA